MKRMIKIQIIILSFIYTFSGCLAIENNLTDNSNVVLLTNAISDNDTVKTNNPMTTKNPIENEESKLLQIDLTDYFQGINGSMVIYNDSMNEYMIFNKELSEKRSSPCSTFKIVSSLIGLNEKILKSTDTVIAWNGTNYPVDEWNRDLTLIQAFRSSCIWYFRNVIDRIGKETVNKTLIELSYGNCDTSQWEGSNTNQNYEELNGFWLESSLLISPREQVDVLIRIFSGESNISNKNISIIKDIMKIHNTDGSFFVYGKTGTGIKDGHCVDAWFIGIAESGSNTYYFALRLDDPENSDASGQKAKEIALDIINNYL